jgi:hypothetical protein
MKEENLGEKIVERYAWSTVRLLFFNSSFILYFRQGLTGSLAEMSLVKKLTDKARMSFVGFHKVK